MGTARATGNLLDAIFAAIAAANRARARLSGGAGAIGQGVQQRRSAAVSALWSSAQSERWMALAIQVRPDGIAPDAVPQEMAVMVVW